MKSIVLLHPHYEKEHLAEVTEEMKTLGAPKIRAIWSEMHGVWFAVEGCHRLRAAEILNLAPIVIDISADETAIIQLDACDEEINVIDTLIDMQDDAINAHIINY